ncbi:MAG: NAD(+) synthase [Vampirovibrionales bacterium]|nr:NAD(+) synthase [Vampirovibrionales bacterium]
MDFSSQTRDFTTPSPELQQTLSAADPTAVFRQINAYTNAQLQALVQPSWASNASADAHDGQALNALIQATPVQMPSIFIGQTNPAPADILGNAMVLHRCIVAAETLARQNEQPILCAFPELALMGYPVRDVITRHPALVQQQRAWLSRLAQACQSVTALVGFVEPRHAALRDQWTEAITLPPDPLESTIGKPYYNAVAVLGQGKLLGVVRKCLLPTYAEYDDDRTFEAAVTPGICWQQSVSVMDNTPLLPFAGRQWAVTICEDLWNDAVFFEHPLYALNPVEALMQQGAAGLINLSASVSRARKEALKSNLLKFTAQKYGRPVLYVNQAGGVDECVFDGQSRFLNARGETTAMARAFGADALMLELGYNTPEVSVASDVAQALHDEFLAVPQPDLQPPPPEPKGFFPDDPTELARAHAAITTGIADYFAKTGFTRAVLGLSGGLDSAVCAALLVDALGAKNVLGVSMPSRLTPAENQSDTEMLARALDMPFIERPIAPCTEPALASVQAAATALEATWGLPDAHSTASENVQAITRATLLRLLGNQYRALPIATSDKSELYLGYATINGDMSGALAPLGDVPKTKVRALGDWINAQAGFERIPKAILDRPPSADLQQDAKTGKSILAEEALMPYAFADEVIWRIEALGQGLEQMLITSFTYEATHTLATETKTIWLNRFFNRMNAALFKWWVVPPILIVAGNGSITKTDYRHPITACRAQWT